jgi:tetratricopeptide (TPR) repeat protein
MDQYERGGDMKQFLKAIGIGICIGTILLILRGIFDIDWDLFIGVIWIAAIFIVLGTVLVNVLYMLPYQRKIKEIVPLLDDGKTEQYISRMEELLRNAKGRNLRNVLRINIAAGYIQAKQYHTAIDILEAIQERQLIGSAVKLCYRINLCTGYFYSNQYEQAMRCYQDSRNIFTRWRSNKTYGGYIAELDILAAIQRGQYEQAKELLDTAQRSWKETRQQEAFEEIRHTLEQR